MLQGSNWMQNATHRSAKRGCLASRLSELLTGALLIALLTPGSAIAADFSCTSSDTPNTNPATTNQLTELEEVVVTPRAFVSRTRDLGAWLKRLEGQFRYEGYVLQCGNDRSVSRRPVTGKAACVSLHNGANEAQRSLYCVADVKWSTAHSEVGEQVEGSTLPLSPTVITYGVKPDLPGIQFMQLDSKGIATHGSGKLTGDTLVASEPCGPGDTCRKVTRITARPESDEITMIVDIQIDSRREIRHSFLLHRLSNRQMRKTPNDLLTRDDLLLVGER